MRARAAIVVVAVLAACRSSTPATLGADAGADAGAAAGELVPLLPTGVDFTAADVIAAGDGYLVAWGQYGADALEDDETFHVVRVSPVGAPLGASIALPFVGNSTDSRLELVALPDGFALWHFRRGQKAQLAFLDANGAVLTMVETAYVQVGYEDRVDVARNPSAAVTGFVYEETGGIFLRRYADTGGELSPSVDLGDGDQATIVAHGGDFDVFWRLNSDLLTARIDASNGAVVAAPAAIHNGTVKLDRVDAVELTEGSLIGWNTRDGAGDGRSFLYRADAPPTWVEPTTLLPANRLASLDTASVAVGKRALLAALSDAEGAQPRLVVGSIEPGAGEVGLTPVLELGGVRALRTVRLAAGAAGAAALIGGLAPDGEQLYLVPLP